MMQVLFLYGQAASGKFTVGRQLAELTGRPLFHNHLVVDAVAAVFPFGSPEFVALRDLFWMEMFAAAAAAGRSFIFTFAPEPSVDPTFPQRARAVVEAAGGEMLMIALDVSAAEQEARIDAVSRAAFGKLRSLELLQALRGGFEAAMAAMPEADLRIDTTETGPDQAARKIVEFLLR